MMLDSPNFGIALYKLMVISIYVAGGISKFAGRSLWRVHYYSNLDCLA